MGFKTFCKNVSRNGSKITYRNNDGEARVWVLPTASADDEARPRVLPGATAERRTANTVEIRGTPINPLLRFPAVPAWTSGTFHAFSLENPVLAASRQ